MKPTLVILAAGMASRYGSMKQVQSFGPSGETIMDYSIYDAIRSGFGKVVFVIREQFADQFKSIFEPKLAGRIQTEYVYQELDSYTGDYAISSERTKPWGTAHAVLCAKPAVTGPFAVINADDFYGREAFERAMDFLLRQCSAQQFALVGYELSGTLSAHGTVNRGICTLDANGNLAAIAERINISKRENEGFCDDGKAPQKLPLTTQVSMNFWCFAPSFFNYTAVQFSKFLEQQGHAKQSEFFIPLVVDQFIQEGGIVSVVSTRSRWFGVTYKEDAPLVAEGLKALIDAGEYPDQLWS